MSGKGFESVGPRFAGVVRSSRGRDRFTLEGDGSKPICLSCWRRVEFVDPEGVCMDCGCAS